MSMEQNGNQKLASPLFCRNGCGFYAAQAFDGMCSKCYKDLKEPQDQQSHVATSVPSPSPPTPTVGARSLPGAGTDDVDAVTAALSKTSLTEMNVNSSSNPNNNETTPEKHTDARPTSGETSQPHTPLTTGQALDTPDDGQAAGVDGETASDGEKGKKPKKNRCMECRKKVGLTGFVCHCGKLFCSLHRYSDTHECSFDFRERGQEEIRRNNPVVKGEKIQKI
ncbi:zinc finger A20 and AN1 domain-containing stress-associated protein 9 [Aplysia californica]|uniref:Zinc finger A20 and AN1 domain-containing stress-associated protein 9 n=1 Tax=Aplysia californica TaxID=6500 RepID=A0ABM1AEN5_APLCA|nr:zinc finger A20 and AN1 domain-containing stress-associated protein 9 [Aplysia californica]XP_012946231.1 zinc finger A20 and AN1 domain-containing stress-associated protein 9 [Aplysia californica]XP_035829498.1 zinc finger A20 and AN1 domain-containing stress-associated protein 9 [Aplysia californica]